MSQLYGQSDLVVGLLLKLVFALCGIAIVVIFIKMERDLISRCVVHVLPDLIEWLATEGCITNSNIALRGLLHEV